MYYPKTSHERGSKHSWLKWWATVAGGVVVVAGVFALGVGVGNGKITLVRANAQNKNLPADLNYASVEQLYDTLKANYDGTLDTNKLVDGMKAGLAEASGDAYTVYLNAKQAKDFNSELNGTTFSGIGAELGQDEQKNLIIVSPIDGFPASKAGLRPQDVLVSIDGKSAAGLSVEEAVTKIRGPKDTKVSLKVLRNKSQELSFTITRQDIKIPSVKSEILDNGLGYLRISRFGDDTFGLVSKAANEFKDRNVKGIVVDLRGNPGGLLDAATKVSNLWLPEGKVIVQEKKGNTSAGTQLSNGMAPLLGIPTAVLIDAGSASASEIVAGALHDNGVAKIFGVKSFGKGSVQQIISLAGGSEAKITIARWYRPNGQNIDKKGISPDTEVKMTDEDYEKQRDPQKDAAIQFLLKKP